MNQRPEPTNTQEEASLFAFGDQSNSRPSNDLEATMLRVQRASGVGTTGSSAIPADLKLQIWEDLMSTNAVAMDIPYHHRRRVAVPSPRGITPPASHDRSRNHRPRPSNTAANALLAFNALLAAALILALVAGIWRATGGVNLGFGDNDPGQPTIPFGGAVTQDDDGIDLPTAEDCTVEPLTVDEVIWYITDPYEASYSSDIASPGPMPTEIVPATPPATNPPNYVSGYASQENLNAAAETQRMLTACVLADSYFQVWALLEPSTVRNMFHAHNPPLTGDDETRVYLEALEQNGQASPDDPGKFYSMVNAVQFAPAPGQGIWVLDTDPTNSWQPHPRVLIAGFATYNEDGMLLYEPSSIFENIEGAPIAGSNIGLIDRLGCSFEFDWNDARQKWLVSSGPMCMG